MIKDKTLLTDFLNQIGDEEITICINDERKTVSRTEALARKMYLLAMGGIEEVIDEAGTMGKVYHKPDYRVAKMIREFTEGKAAAEIPFDNKNSKKAGAFSSSIGKRLNDRLGPKRPKSNLKGK